MALAAVLIAILGTAQWRESELRGPRHGGLRLPVSRDTWVSAYPGERDGNLGAERRIKLKSIQEMALVDFDPGTELGRRVVRSARLHLRCDPEIPLRRISVSSLASPWWEGRGRRYRVTPGASSFSSARQEQLAWAYGGSDLMAVINGAGQSRWHFSDPTPPDRRGWQRIEIDASLVALRRAGASQGFVLFDDVGSEYRRGRSGSDRTDGSELVFLPMRNRFCASREAGRSRAPFFELELGEVDSRPPLAPAGVEGSTSETTGEATLRFVEPEDRGVAGVVAFEARLSLEPEIVWSRARIVPRYLIPLATGPGTRHELRLGDLDLEPRSAVTVGIRAVDGVGNRSPISTTQLRIEPGQERFSIDRHPLREQAGAVPESEVPRLGNLTFSVVDPLDKVDPVDGRMIPGRTEGYRHRNHLWSADGARVHLFAARNEFVSFQLVVDGARDPGLTDPLRARLHWEEEGIGTEILRTANVATTRGPLPDPLLPAGRTLMEIEPGAAPGRLNHRSFLVDLRVAPDAAPGLHSGALELTSGEHRLDLKIDLTVWHFTLPNELSFVPQMNAYMLPEPPEEIEYYRLAQRHRTVLNRVPYGWTGRVLPAMAGTLATPRSDWSEFEKRFGPLLDGSAFADLPRGSIPVERFYLPLNENWPVSIEQGFIGGYWPEQALTNEYRASLVKATTRLVQGLAVREYDRTLFEIYLNNKFMHKVARGDWGASSAPWTFDEPIDTRDYWALRWYGEVFQEGIAAARTDVAVAYRADISRPQFQRDILDPVLDTVYYGADARRYARMVRERQERTGQLTQLYGRPNPIEQSNVQPVAWSLDAWSRGMDGVLPWLSIGSSRAWARGETTALLYPGEPRGLVGPVPGLRLKAFRRGQQDIEYLTLLEQLTDASRRSIEAAVKERLSLDAQVLQTGTDDAGEWRYPGVKPEDLWALRISIGERIDRRVSSAMDP